QPDERRSQPLKSFLRATLSRARFFGRALRAAWARRATWARLGLAHSRSSLVRRASAVEPALQEHRGSCAGDASARLSIAETLLAQPLHGFARAEAFVDQLHRELRALL